MIRPVHRLASLAAVMLSLLLLGATASAATPSASGFPYTTTTLTHAGVVHLIAHGERLRLTSKLAEKTEVRLFVYEGALERGAHRPIRNADEKVYISRNAHVIFDHPGVRWVTLHVNRAYRDALLHAGTITEGYYYAGYKLIHHSQPRADRVAWSEAADGNDDVLLDHLHRHAARSRRG